MKFLNISDSKLKVTLTRADCIEYGIDTSAGNYTSREVRESVRKILELAESECSFSVGTEKILVQLYPLPSGECELLVTKLTTLSRKHKEALSSSEGVSVLESTRGIYRFESIEDIHAAVRVTYREGTCADLYRDTLGRYYLYIEEKLTDGISEFEILTEYGERLPSVPSVLLSEYGECLSKGEALDYIISHAHTLE